MTAQTLPEALAAEAARGAEHIASIRAEGFRAGAEAMREAAAKVVDDNFRTAGNPWPGRAVRSLPIPEIDR